MGVFVPEGFTFVRPHRRGTSADREREKVYRSRSALRCLRAIPPSAGDERDGWFTFERNVADWLAREGYEVDHLAASRTGDGGVDIQASRIGEVLLVQCKRWARPVGPSTVRELIGTLTTFPDGARGVLVLSGSLTEGAKTLAYQAGIQFIENVDFGRTVDGSLRR
jgi:HJR/Mrr/RecB family endonuclease